MPLADESTGKLLFFFKCLPLPALPKVNVSLLKKLKELIRKEKNGSVNIRKLILLEKSGVN